MKRDFDVIAAIEAWDAGKAYDEKRFQTQQLPLNVLSFAQMATKISGETIEMGNGKLGYTISLSLWVSAAKLFLGSIPTDGRMGLPRALAAGMCKSIKKLAEQIPLSVIISG